MARRSSGVLACWLRKAGAAGSWALEALVAQAGIASAARRQMTRSLAFIGGFSGTLGTGERRAGSSVRGPRRYITATGFHRAPPEAERRGANIVHVHIALLV